MTANARHVLICQLSTRSTVRHCRTLFVTRNTVTTPMTAIASRASSARLALLGALADAGAGGHDALRARAARSASRRAARSRSCRPCSADGFVADSGAGMSRRYRLGMALARLGDSSSRRSRCATSRCPCSATSPPRRGSRRASRCSRAPYAVVIGRVDAASRRRPLRDEPVQARADALLRGRQVDARRDPRAATRARYLAAGRACRARRRTRSPTSSSCMRELADVAAQGYCHRRRGGRRGRVLRRLADRRRLHGGCAGAISVTGLKARRPGLAPAADRRERARARGAGSRSCSARRRERCRHEARARRRAARARSALVERAIARARPGGGRHPPGLLRPVRHRPRAAATACVDPAFVRYPLTLGHEWSGVVEAVGDGVAGHRAGRSRRGRVHHPVRHVRPVPRRRHERLHDLRRARLHARGRGERPGRRSRAARARPRARGVRCSTPRSSSRPSVVMRGLEKATPEPGRARARDRRRHDRAARGAARRALVAGGDRRCWAAGPSRPQLARAVGATAFTTDDAVAEGFDLVIEAAGVPAAAMTRRPRGRGVAVACCCSACRRPGKRSSCPPTCS